MPKLAAAEAETIFDATFSLLKGQLGDVYDVNIHSVEVFDMVR